MIERFARFLVFALLTSVWTSALGLPIPNRGKQLFLLIEGQKDGVVIAMDEPSRPVIQQWHRDYPIYDFIYATVKQTDSGWRVHFTRYVMADDYSPRQEQQDITFPYSAQLRRRLFDYGFVTGFYRNSVHDIDPQEFLPQKSSNHAMERTPNRPYAWIYQL